MKRLLISLAIALSALLPNVASADSVAFYGRSDGKFDNGGVNTTFTDSIFITSTSTNTALVACVYWDNRTGGASLNGIKIGSTQMTQINTDSVASAFTGRMYYLLSPPTGTQTITASSSGAFTVGSKQFAMVSLHYTGVSQVSPPDSTNQVVKNGASDNPFTMSTTVVAANSWLVGCPTSDAGTFSTAGSGTTYRGSAAGNIQQADSNGVVGTGSQSLNWTTNATPTNFEGHILSLAPAVSAVSTVINSIIGLVKALWIY
jgi:hypothetical protein